MFIYISSKCNVYTHGNQMISMKNLFLRKSTAFMTVYFSDLHYSVSVTQGISLTQKMLCCKANGQFFSGLKTEEPVYTTCN